MTAKIDLIIRMPEKITLDEKVYRVVLPYDDKRLTVIEDRAPTLMALDFGVLQILNEKNEVKSEWFIAGGIADIKENTCVILTEAVCNKNEIDLDKARELYQNFANPFFEWIVKYFERNTYNSKR